MKKKRKIAVVYYSRGGQTKKVAQAAAAALDADIEEIIDTKKRIGLFPYFAAGFAALFRRTRSYRRLRLVGAGHPGLVVDPAPSCAHLSPGLPGAVFGERARPRYHCGQHPTGENREGHHTAVGCRGEGCRRLCEGGF
jgi:hypothetical protein